MSNVTGPVAFKMHKGNWLTMRQVGDYLHYSDTECSGNYGGETIADGTHEGKVLSRKHLRWQRLDKISV